MLQHTMRRLSVVAVLAVLAGCDKGPEIVKATWASKPTAAEVAEVYPAFARMARIPGKIEVRCNYDRQGVLSRCRRIGVAPAGLKFEDALKRLLPKYRVTPQTVDGITAPSEITFVISFNPSQAPKPYAGPPATAAELAGVRRVVSIVSRYESAMAQRAASYAVDVDRMSVVSAMVDRAYKAEGAAVEAALPLALIQATPAEDRAVLARGQSYRVYSRTELEAVSPEYHAAMGRLAAHIRNEYCAAYACDPTLPVETK
ncbi:MAG: hypothetical protein V4707_09430 [Pseudomonadota bacterium]